MISCPVLCNTADNTEIPIMETQTIFILISSKAAIELRRPPDKLIRNAVPPLVIRTKNDLNRTIISVSEHPIEDAANIITIFDRPGLAPGGKNGSEGRITFSIIESTIASAPSIPSHATPGYKVFLLYFNLSVCNCI